MELHTLTLVARSYALLTYTTIIEGIFKTKLKLRTMANMVFIMTLLVQYSPEGRWLLARWLSTLG